MKKNYSFSERLCKTLLPALLILSVAASAQSGTSCTDAFVATMNDSCVSGDYSISDSKDTSWIAFVATATDARIALTEPGQQPETHVHSLSLYSGSCSAPILIQSKSIENGDTTAAGELHDIFVTGLVTGDTFYITVSHQTPAICTDCVAGNSFYALCVEKIEPELTCGTDIFLDAQYQMFSDLQDLIDEQEDWIRSSLRSSGSNLRTLGVDSFIIPVVVHVVHDTGEDYGTGANISYDQINSQIDALNAAYQASNAGVSTGIRFCLAQIPSPDTLNWATDTAGNPEPGIMRYESNRFTNATLDPDSANALAAFTNSSSSHFPFDKYMNIWVVTNIDLPGSGGITQGYAPLPLSPETGVFGFQLDGIVIRSDVFGDNTNPDYCQCFDLAPNANNPHPRNQGKILVHEVGHYLRMLHTFYNSCTGMTDSLCLFEGDYVCDTPPCESPSSSYQYCSSTDSVNSCQENITYSNLPGNPFRIDSTTTDAYDLIENYMFLALDNCWLTFTQGQIDRMHAFIQSSRSNLVSLVNLSDVGVAGPNGCISPQLYAGIIFSPSLACANDTLFVSTPTGPGLSAINWTWDFGDGSPLISGTPDTSHVYAADGIYTVTLMATDGTDTIFNSQSIVVSPCLPIQSTQGNWYFGRYAGLDFSSGTPLAETSAWNNKTMNTPEACVTVSDSLGKLLFYSNGVDVWDSTHSLVNTTPLDADISNSQVIAIPNPANSSEYFLFYKNKNNNQLNYTKINTSGSNITLTAIDINVNLTKIHEQITAVPHCNGRDYWIITDQHLATNFVVFLVNMSGVEQFSSGPGHKSIGTFGQLKASPDGTKLAMGDQSSDGYLILCDFNPTTGIIASCDTISTLPGYGVSFSPDSDILYYSRSGQIVGFDLTAPDPSATETIVSTINDRYYSLQIGPDSMVYIAKIISGSVGQDNLAVITNPNDLLNPGFVNNGVSLITSPNDTIESKWGLPNMVDAKSGAALDPEFSYTFIACFEAAFQLDSCWQIYDQEWDFGDGNTVSTNDPTHTFPGFGSYFVTLYLTMSNDTVYSHTAEINISQAFPLISGPEDVCVNETYNYTVNADSGFTYEWSVQGGSLANTTGSSVLVGWNTVGTGSLTVIAQPNDSFCPADTATIGVTIHSEPVLSLAADTVCAGNCDGSIIANVSGGLAPFTYQWFDQSGNLVANDNPATGLCPGTYLVIVTDAIGCGASAGDSISKWDIVLSITSTGIDCFGDGDGSATVLASGGTSPYEYNWSSGGTTDTETGLSGGTYTVTVTDANVCTATATATITEPTQLTAAAIADNNVTCLGGSDGQATGSGSGGTPSAMGYNFEWPDGQTTAIATGLAAGTYTVTVTDANGCTATATLTITEPGPVEFDLTGTGLLCNGDCDGSATVLLLNGLPPYTFEWSNGATTDHIEDLCAGNYDVTVTNVNGCTGTATATITEPPLLTVDISTSPETCDFTRDGSATANPAGGTPPYSYLWSNGVTTQDNPWLSEGTYSVTVTDDNGCTATAGETVGIINSSINYDYPNGLIITSNSQVINGLAVNGHTLVKVKGVIYIEPGVKYTMEDLVIEFSPNPMIPDIPDPLSGIVVKTDAQLTLKNTTLRGIEDCNNMWHGVQVWGDQFRRLPVFDTRIRLPLMNALEGSLRNGKLIMNNAQIQDAYVGVLLNKRPRNLWDPADLTREYGRGIIEATNSRFINNDIGIAFSGRTLINNKSFVKNNTFTANAPLLDLQTYNGSGSSVFISLSKVKSIPITANTFNGHTAFDKDERATGIFSFDASYTVESAQVGFFIFDPPTPNTFNNLTKGIDAFSTGGTGKNITIKDNRFNNVQQGITANGTSFDEISLNVFNVPEGTSSLDAWGVFLYNAFGYLVTENEFNAAAVPPNQYTFGLVSESTTNQAGEVYKNDFPGNFHSATHMQDDNDQLQVKCNRYLSNDTEYDWAVTSGTLADQGVCNANDQTSPAGNRFKICPVINQSQIFVDNVNASGFVYATQPDIAPICVSSTVVVDPCLDLFVESSACPTVIDIPCGPPCLLAERTAFENESPGMRKEVMKSGLIRALLNAGELADVLNVLASSNDPKDIKLLVPTFLSFGECQMAEDELIKLPLNTQENIRFRELFDILIGACKNDRNERELTPGERVNVRTISTSPEKVAVHADAVLTIADSTEYFRLVEEIQLQGGSFKKGAAMVENDKALENETAFPKIKVVPNPSNGNNATILYEFTQGDELTIFNAIGSKVRSYEIKETMDKITVDNLEHGVYFVIVAKNGVFVANEKMIIIK